MGSFVIDSGQRMSKKEEEYWKNYHLMHNHQWTKVIVESADRMFELRDVDRKNMVDRITEDRLVPGERVLRINTALSKNSITLSLKNIKKYGNWKRTRTTLLNMIKEIDELDVESGPTLEEVEEEIKRYREIIS